MKEPVWIDERDALALHDRLLALHGGAVGLRDDGLLKSALARPQQHFADAESADIVDMAAAYTWGIVRNHPFVDGNKRTGFVVGVLFLELNGYRFNASEEDAAQMVLELASGNLDEAGYIAFLRAHASLEKMKQHFRAQQRESLVEGRIARDDAMGAWLRWRRRVSSAAAIPPRRSCPKARFNSMRFIFWLLGFGVDEIAVNACFSASIRAGRR